MGKTPKDSDQLSEEAIAVLKKRNVAGPCPRCKSSKWSAEAFGLLTTQLPPTGGVNFPHAPIVMLTCVNCGWMGMHSLLVLGVSAQEEE